jgi:pimeloyl-ACP methyl ester carboxylesterase
MDDLAAKLQEQGFSAIVDNHASWSALAERIIAARQAGSKRQIVLIGHSLGGDDVIKVAERLNQAGIAVDLLMPVDPVSPGAVPGNVRRVVNYFQSNNGFGQAVRPGVGFRGVLVNSDLETNRRDLRDPTTGHTTIDKGVKVQLDILREVRRVRGSSVAQRRGAAGGR